MTLIDTKTTVDPKTSGQRAPKAWRLGSGGGRRSEAGEGPARGNGNLDGKLDGKILAKSRASLAESERMLSRQTALLDEMRANGLITTEAEKSVARLEAALIERRSAHDGLLAKASAEDDAASGPTRG